MLLFNCRLADFNVKYLCRMWTSGATHQPTHISRAMLRTSIPTASDHLTSPVWLPPITKITLPRIIVTSATEWFVNNHVLNLQLITLLADL